MFINRVWFNRLKRLCSKNLWRCRFIFVAKDDFSKFLCTAGLLNENAQTNKNSFETILTTSNPSPKLDVTDVWKKIVNKPFTNFLNNKHLKRYYTYTSKGNVFAKRFNRTIKNLLENPVFEKQKGNCVGVFPTNAKKCNITLHSTIKLTPVRVSLKTNKKEVLNNLKEKNVQQASKFKVCDLVRTADFMKTFPKGDTIKWFSELYTETEVGKDTLPIYHKHRLLESIFEASLSKTTLKLKKNKKTLRQKNITDNHSTTHLYYLILSKIAVVLHN